MSAPATKRNVGAGPKRPPPVDTFSAGTLTTASVICAIAYSIVAVVAYSDFKTLTDGNESLILIIPVSLTVQIVGLLIVSQEISTGWPGLLGPCYTAAAASFALAGVYAVASGLPSGYRMLALFNGSVYAGMLVEAVTGVTGKLLFTTGSAKSGKKD
ncbi:hypothetical protein ACHAQA_009414 [Verticillium albo-atrum]